MKKTILALLIMMGLGFQMNIQAQFTACTDVIFPLCPKQTSIPPQMILSPDSQAKLLNSLCGDTIVITKAPKHGTLYPPDSSITLIDSTLITPIIISPLDTLNTASPLEDTTIFNLTLLYEPNTNCFPTDTFEVSIYNHLDSVACSSVTYILHFESECETPDDVFCCIAPNDTLDLNVLANDTTFIEEIYAGGTILGINIVHDSLEEIPLGIVTLPSDSTFVFASNGSTGVDSFSYQVTYTIITASEDTITVCDEQWCYVFVEDCLNSMPDIACIAPDDIICIDPLANDLVEPTLYDPILDSLGCTNPLPMIDPTMTTMPMPLGSADSLWSDSNDGWCFTSTSVGTYTYIYDVCTDAGECATDSIVITVKPNCIFDDYIALRALYLSTDGDNWTNNTGWPDAATFLTNPTSPPPGFMGFDTWYGVKTNNTGCVTRLSLQDNQLVGNIPSQIGNLSHLTRLYLHSNQLSCNIPPEIGDLSNLTILNMRDNQLSGNIPLEIGNLSILTTLNLGSNQLSGIIPSEIGTLSVLTSLNFSLNQLSGNIPMEIGNLSALKSFYVHFNQLSGGIPSEIGNLANLRLIYLASNQLTGCYDTNLSNLCNQLTYSSNARISDGNNLDADWEDFCTPQQDGICNCLNDDYAALRALYLSTYGDNWSINTGWPNATLFNDPLYATTPPPGYTDLNTWYGVTVNATGCVSDVYLQDNNLVGAIPAELDRLREVTYLNLALNQLTGSIPAILGNMVNLTNLDLSDNQLTGSLTAELGNLNQLNILDVRNNQLAGCFDINLLNLCGQLLAALVDTGNNFDANWTDFCNSSAGACTLPGNCLTDVQLHVYLEGPYTGSAAMQTNLNTLLHVLPGQTNGSTPPTTSAGQPYNTFPWNYTGTEGAGWTNANYPATVVDWVMVSLRTGIDRSTEVDRVAALLHSDGSVSFIGAGLFLPTSAHVYIIIEHRNHMGVMTPTPVSLTGGVLTYDFRMANSYDANGTGFGQKEITPGVWTMYAGDADQSDFPSYDVNGNDKTLWEAQNGNFDVYTQADFNMDGDVNGMDKGVWSDNNGSSSRVLR